MLCPDEETTGTIEHMLVSCTALRDKRQVLDTYIHDQTEDNLPLRAVIGNVTSSTITNTVQFLLDPSVIPSVQDSIQQKKFKLEEIFAITCTYCYALHRRRLQLIGRFNFLCYMFN